MSRPNPGTEALALQEYVILFRPNTLVLEVVDGVTNGP